MIFASPHSGRCYSPRFLRQTRLGERTLRSTEDAFIDMLFSDAPEFGAPLICATAPRAFVDMNRAPDELDPMLIAGLGSCSPSRRARAGYGVIPRLVGRGQRIYVGKIGREEADRRISQFHVPYHLRLSQLMDECVSRFGEAVLLDCHSTPHEALERSAFSGWRPPEVVLGDRFGKSCCPAVIERAEAVFASSGLKVSRNAPFSGAYVSRRYGDPARRRHVLQIEIDRGLYLEESTLRRNSGFQEFRRFMRGVTAGLAGRRSGSLPAAG